MNDLILQLYQKFNPGVPIRSPSPKYIVRPTIESYGLRWFDKKRYQDFHDLVTIDRQELLLQNMFPKTPSRKKYFIDVFDSKDKHSHDHFYVFAICDQTDKVVGWIQYMIDDYRAKLKKIASLPGRPLILEVSYAKLLDPKYPRVVVNSLKNSIDIVKKIDNLESKEIYLSGYTDPTNSASEFVLNANDFEKLSEQMLYINEVTNIWIKKIN